MAGADGLQRAARTSLAPLNYPQNSLKKDLRLARPKRYSDLRRTAMTVPFANMNSRQTFQRRGFTLIELLTVIATIAVLAGVGFYEARQVSALRRQVQTLAHQQLPAPASSNAAALSSVQNDIDRLAAQNAALTNALAQANADKSRLEMEREQAKRAAALYKELAEEANAKDPNPTNAYPTSRHVWAAFGRLGRVAALAKEDDSQSSPEEKSALEAARMKALEGLPNLVKAFKQ